MIARRAADDDGVTLLELVIAAFILFVAVTAVFGLILKALDMSVQAKQQNIALSVGSSYMEQVRALPYNAVGVVGGAGGSVPGSLSVSTSMTVSSFRVVLTPYVVMMSDPNIGADAYKSLTVTVTVDAPGLARPITRVVRTFVRKIDAQQTAAASVPGALSIVYGSGMPVRNSWVSGDLGIPFTARNTNTSVMITSVSILGTRSNPATPVVADYLSGLGTPDSVPVAQWTDKTENPLTGVFTWQTDANEIDGVTPKWPDGQYDLNGTTVDGVGNISHILWVLVIDNDPPISPPAPVASLYRSDLSRVSWYRTLIPGVDAYKYVIHVWQDNRGSDPACSPWTFGSGWTDLGEPFVTQPRQYYDVVSAPFTRYEIRLEPFNLGGASGGMTDMVRPFVSRPRMTGLSTVTYSSSTKVYTTTNSLTMAGPAFTSSARTLTLYRSVNADMSNATAVQTWTTDDPSYAFEETYTSGSKDTPPTQYYYRMTCTITPSGWSGGTPLTVYSARLGPSPGAVATNVALTESW